MACSRHVVISFEGPASHERGKSATRCEQGHDYIRPAKLCPRTEPGGWKAVAPLDTLGFSSDSETPMLKNLADAARRSVFEGQIDRDLFRNAEIVGVEECRKSARWFRIVACVNTFAGLNPRLEFLR